MEGAVHKISNGRISNGLAHILVTKNKAPRAKILLSSIKDEVENNMITSCEKTLHNFITTSVYNACIW